MPGLCPLAKRGFWADRRIWDFAEKSEISGFRQLFLGRKYNFTEIRKFSPGSRRLAFQKFAAISWLHRSRAEKASEWLAPERKAPFWKICSDCVLAAPPAVSYFGGLGRVSKIQWGPQPEKTPKKTLRVSSVNCYGFSLRKPHTLIFILVEEGGGRVNQEIFRPRPR